MTSEEENHMKQDLADLKSQSVLELSIKLADEAVRHLYGKQIRAVDKEVDGVIYYTDDAQEDFNDFADMFQGILEEENS